MKLPFLNKRITPLIPLTLLLTILLILIIVFVSPHSLINLVLVEFSVLYPVFFLVFLVFFGIGTLLFKSRFHGMLLSLFVIFFLLLRVNDLKQPIFTVILIALFITTEFFFSQSSTQKQTRRARRQSREEGQPTE